MQSECSKPSKFYGMKPRSSYGSHLCWFSFKHLIQKHRAAQFVLRINRPSPSWWFECTFNVGKALLWRTVTFKDEGME
jgi:hypothetical protein